MDRGEFEDAYRHKNFENPSIITNFRAFFQKLRKFAQWASLSCPARAFALVVFFSYESSVIIISKDT